MELVRFPSRRGFSVRSIFTFVLAVIMTAILSVTLVSSPTSAQSADARWNGASLTYDGNQYVSAGKATGNESHNIAKDSTLYVFVENAPTGMSAGNQKAHIIYFTPGLDPPTAESATYQTFEYAASTRTYSNPSNATTISIDQASASTGATSCAVEGIGWIVCPVMNFLAWGMDTVFGLIAEFMEVQPLQTGNENSGLFSAWNIMRGIANIAFIIVFIIIIYSQLTNIQVSNYGLKRLIPRLIIAAVAVNLSYIICAVAIDVSNVLGYSLQDIFLGIRDQIYGTSTEGLSAQLVSWESVTGFVLSGGTAVLALGIGAAGALVATGGTVLGLVFLLLPALVGLLVAVLVVLLVLAARQAIITILVIIAPIAIVAYLLPNTEKWFEKWRGLLLTMLIFFPAFSVVFGGSQLAGAIIVYNADSINMLILGMIVMVAPLIITPLILKFSGSLLANIARVVNNPNKGIMDRTRNWSKSHADWQRNRGMSGASLRGAPGELGKKNFMRRSARYLDQRKLRREDRTKNASTGVRTAYENSSLYNKYDLAGQTAAFEADKEATHAHHTAHVEKLKTTPGSLLHGRAMNAQAQKDYAEAAQQNTGAYYNAQRIAGGSPLNASYSALETSKTLFEASEQDKTAYITTQKTARITQLGMAAERLEAAKLNAEGVQSTYTAHIENLKVSGTSNLGDVARFAASSKDHAEAAQMRVQTMFDRERATADGNRLNVATIEIEQARIVSEGAKAQLSEYIAEVKSPNGVLHTEYITTERRKQGQQIAESHLTRIIEEYKSGSADVTGLSASEQAIIEDMVRNTETLAAESQGSQAAQNIQKKQIAEAFTATYTDPATGEERKTARAEELLNIAKSVDEYGDVRAEAVALSTLEDITNKARTANEALIEERAVANNKTPKNYALSLLEDQLQNPNAHSEDIIRAAMEIAGKEAQIPIIRRMRKSTNINQDHLTAMLLRNSGTMKAKGGFDLQNDTGLVHATDEVMDASIAGTLGSTSAEQFKDLKNGAIIEYANNMNKIMANTQAMENSQATDPEVRAKEQKYGRNGIEGIQKTYFNLTMALRDPQMVRALGDNLIPAIKMHRKIHADARFHNEAMQVDYSKIDPQNLSEDINPEDLGVGFRPQPPQQ